jgi:hypothetical protein
MGTRTKAIVFSQQFLGLPLLQFNLQLYVAIFRNFMNFFNCQIDLYAKYNICSLLNKITIKERPCKIAQALKSKICYQCELIKTSRQRIEMEKDWGSGSGFVLFHRVAENYTITLR